MFVYQHSASYQLLAELAIDSNSIVVILTLHALLPQNDNFILISSQSGHGWYGKKTGIFFAERLGHIPYVLQDTGICNRKYRQNCSETNIREVTNGLLCWLTTYIVSQQFVCLDFRSQMPVYRMSTNETTHHTLFFLMTGRYPVLPKVTCRTY